MRQFHLLIIISVLLSITVNAQDLKKYRVISNSERFIVEFTGYGDSIVIKHGTYQYFYEGKLLVKGTYNHGLKHGLWVHYNESDVVIMRSYYKDSVRYGDWKYYYETGEPASIIAYKDNEKHGFTRGYAKDGKLIYEVEYIDGKRNGKETINYNDGGRKSISYFVNGKTDSIQQLYFPNGQLHRTIKFKNNIPCQTVNTFDALGNTIDGGNLNNSTGIVKTYIFGYSHPDSLKLTTLETYADSKKMGLWQSYYKNGQVHKTGLYANDTAIGEWIIYGKDGSVSRRAEANDISIKSADSGDVELLQFSEIMPRFPRGEAALLRHLGKETTYPPYARENDIEGTVYIRFVIDETGYVSKAEIARGADKILNDEALSVVSSLPPWQPGLINGVAVRVQYIVPLRFKLQ